MPTAFTGVQGQIPRQHGIQEKTVIIPMTTEQILEAVAKLAPEAISCIEGTLQGRSSPNKAQLDSAWRVLEWSKEAAAVRAEKATDTPDVEELKNVLKLVEQW